MLKQSLRSVSHKLAKIKNSRIMIPPCQQTDIFYSLINALHSNIREYLRPRTMNKRTPMKVDSDTQGSLTKSANLPIINSQNNQEEKQLFDESFVLAEYKSLRQNGDVKQKHKKVIKLAKLASEDKNFEELMENIKLIILYQNKVEKLLQSINNQESMAQICLNQNSFDINNMNTDIKQDETSSLYIQCLKDNIHKVIEQCKEIKQVQDNFKQFDGKKSVISLNSQNENSDKKSLLTEMLRASQMLETQNEQSPSPRKSSKKPISDCGYAFGSNKKLLKQIDFSGYKIESIYPRKQKKASRQNCGQCSQCNIF